MRPLFSAALLVAVLAAASCSRDGRYMSPALREAGLTGSVSRAEYRTYRLIPSGDGMQRGELENVRVVGYDRGGVAVADSCSGTLGRYTMRFEPEYSGDGTLAGGRCVLDGGVIYTRRSFFDEAGRISRSVTYSASGAPVDSLCYTYSSDREAIADGMVGDVWLSIRYSNGVPVLRSETDSLTYMLVTQYDRTGRMTSQEFLSCSDAEGDQVSFLREYTLSISYDRDGRVVRRSRRSAHPDDFDYVTEYEYGPSDSHGNWLERTETCTYADGTGISTLTERTVGYHER